MARQRVPVQVNQFVGGLNTENNPLGTSPNTSSDEQNMELFQDGSRGRRDGFNLEDSYQSVDSGITANTNLVIGRSQFRWKNPGGNPSKQFLVVQIGNYLGVHDLDNTPISSATLYSTTFPSDTYTNIYNYASIDGVLVIATGQKEITVLEYDGITITKSTKTLLIRDFFGVEATINSTTLTEAQNFTVRPASLNDEHVYNLRNQTFAIPRVDGDGADNTTLGDPINQFNTYAGSKYPSNADSIIPHLLADANKSSNRTLERFQAEDLFKNPPGSRRAPLGYFIIDALERGASRLTQEINLRTEYPDLDITLALTNLPTDKTEDGATVLEQYAGRVWYAGFKGGVTDGDANSPRMSSYVLFSQTITDPSQIEKCFQEADPTSHTDPDVVDTDGGFIKIDGAYNIKKLVAMKASLFVFAENGVWRIVGADGDSFRATGFSVSKVSDEGCISAGSVVVSNENIFYWGESDIFVIAQNEIGDWSTQNLSENTIRTLYQGLSTDSKSTVSGYFDVKGSSIRWLYGSNIGDALDTYELVLNTKFAAFTYNVIPTSTDVEGPFSVSGGQTVSTDVSEIVTVSGVNVTVSAVDVTVTRTDVTRDAAESFYCIIVGTSPNITYTFGGYKSGTIYDWADFAGGIDSEAYLVTGSITGGDGRLRKNTPYLTMYFKQTEDSDQSGPVSSCLLRSQWDWTTNQATSKWSNTRQAYRRSRFTEGMEIISTRNKIRGFGRSVAFRFGSEAGKTMRIYGWDFNIDSTTEE